MSIQKTVFPDGVEEDESLDSVFRKLNENYLAQTTKPAESSLSSSGGGGFFGWGRKKATPASTPLRHAASSAALSSSAGTLPAAGAASAPGSHMPSRPESVSELADGLDGKFTLAGEEVAANATDDPDAHPQPLWAGDALTTLVISGAALGSGMFGLIFSSVFTSPRSRRQTRDADCGPSCSASPQDAQSHLVVRLLQLEPPDRAQAPHGRVSQCVPASIRAASTATAHFPRDSQRATTCMASSPA